MKKDLSSKILPGNFQFCFGKLVPLMEAAGSAGNSGKTLYGYIVQVYSHAK